MNSELTLMIIKPQFPADIESIVKIIEHVSSEIDRYAWKTPRVYFYTNFDIFRAELSIVLEKFGNSHELVLEELEVLENQQATITGGTLPSNNIINACVNTVVKNSGIYLSLYKKYPDFILRPKHSSFTKNYVGGILAEIRIVYASLESYMALYGTNLDQVGFSGVYPDMHVNDLMISGTMTCSSYGPQGSVPKTFRMGQYSDLKPGEKWTYQMRTLDADQLYQPVYMLDIGYGKIPSAFWEGIILPAIKDCDYRSALVQMIADAEGTAKSIVHTCCACTLL